MTLFLGALRSGAAGNLLFILFGGALFCAIAALGSFTFEMVLAGKPIRRQASPDEDSGLP